MNIFSSIFGGVVQLVAKPIQEWQERKTQKQLQKHEINKLEHEIKLTALNTRLRMAESEQTQNFTLDQLSMQEMKNSYKDEFILIIFITPMILAFTMYADTALKGFEIIKKMPYWYVALIVGMVVVIYGMRGLLTKYLNYKNTFKEKK